MLRRKYRKVSLTNRRTEDPRRTASCFQAHTSQPLTSLPSAHPSDIPPEPRSPPLSLLTIHPLTTIIPTPSSRAYSLLPDASAILFLLLFPLWTDLSPSRCPFARSTATHRPPASSCPQTPQSILRRLHCAHSRSHSSLLDTSDASTH